MTTDRHGDSSQSHTSRTQSPAVLLWGMPGPYTTAVLDALLLARIPVHALILFHDGPMFAGGIEQLLPPDTEPNELVLYSVDRTNPVQVAWQQEIPVFTLSNLDSPKVGCEIEMLTSKNDAIHCVACFPKRIPNSLLNLSPYGFLNVHPSLLPAHRGPYPVFWQLRAGAELIGVSIHRMDPNFDTGPIARQTTVTLPDSVSGPAIDRILGTTGGRLLAHTIRALPHGTQRFRPQLTGGSYQGRPGPGDFTLNRNWSARHAFNFMRGTAEWGYNYLLHIQGKEWRLATALAFDPEVNQFAPLEEHGDHVAIQFGNGILLANLA